MQRRKTFPSLLFVVQHWLKHDESRFHKPMAKTLRLDKDRHISIIKSVSRLRLSVLSFVGSPPLLRSMDETLAATTSIASTMVMMVSLLFLCIKNCISFIILFTKTLFLS